MRAMSNMRIFSILRNWANKSDARFVALALCAPSALRTKGSPEESFHQTIFTRFFPLKEVLSVLFAVSGGVCNDLRKVL